MDTDAIESAASGAENALMADAAAGEAAVAGRVGTGACRNCGSELRGRHCFHCGQVADDFHRPIWTLVADALEGLFSLDGRFWNTVPPLLVRPGRITRNYLTGVRARYMQPFRLFLLASVVFFLGFSISSGDLFDLGPSSPEERRERIAALEEAERELAEAAQGSDAATGAALESVRRELEAARTQLDEQIAETIENDPVIRAAQEDAEKRKWTCLSRRAILPEELGPACESLLAEVEEEGDADELNLDGIEAWPIGFRRLLATNVGTAIDRPETYVTALKTWAPRLIFVLFPVYALLLAAMHFWRRRIYLYDHIIVSLHFHSFLFFFLTILMTAGHFIGAAIPVVVFMIWSNYYLYRLHRLVYGHGRIMSALRVVVVDFFYLLVLCFSLIGLLAVGLIFIS